MRAQAFYHALGCHPGGGVDDQTDHVTFTLTHNVRSPEGVDALLAEAWDAGATIACSGAATFWGGYSGVFIDPDGHPGR